MAVFKRLAFAATALALIVIVLGAWVRLTDAGLGCPDWPGCYGRVNWPSAPEAVEEANLRWAGRPVDTGKAFREMFHRYVAGALGLLILALAVMAVRNRRDPHQPVGLPVALLMLVIFQALLGMWTVTLLLKPVVVLAHLAGGMATFALLWWLSLRTRAPQRPPPLHIRRQRPLVMLALTVLAAQILLGGWVSTNYAALACPDFPACTGQWWPEMDFREGFRLWRGIGVDYEGGILDQAARAAIHVTHRIGALVVIGVFGWLLWQLARTPGLGGTALVLGTALAMQVALGIHNVTGGLPLANAVAHNGMAAVLLAIVLYLLHRTTARP